VLPYPWQSRHNRKKWKSPKKSRERTKLSVDGPRELVTY
jgi:hypothetical protein